jgi:hypothetical protein
MDSMALGLLSRRESRKDLWARLVIDCMALGLLSHRESRKDLWVRLITLLLLYIMFFCTLLNTARCLKMPKMLVFDRTRPSLYSGISAAQSTYTAFL